MESDESRSDEVGGRGSSEVTMDFNSVESLELSSDAEVSNWSYESYSDRLNQNSNEHVSSSSAVQELENRAIVYPVDDHEPASSPNSLRESVSSRIFIPVNEVVGFDQPAEIDSDTDSNLSDPGSPEIQTINIGGLVPQQGARRSVQELIEAHLNRNGTEESADPDSQLLYQIPPSLRTLQLHQMRRALLSFSRNTNDTPIDPNGDPLDRDDQIESPVYFDTNLPAEHSYLGDNMNRVSGVEYLDVGKVHRLMLFLHQYVVYPGEILPFMIPGFIIDSTIDSANGLLFGVAFPHLRHKKNDTLIFGVTCQIYEKGTDERGNTLIKSRALQRFVTSRDTAIEHLEFITARPQLKSYGHVKILPEIYLPEPLQAIDMGSMNRFRGIASLERHFTNYQTSTASWPAHIYKYYNITSIIEKARLSLETHDIKTMPTDPVTLSFWLARNLHLSEEQMKNIFITDSVNLRMKIISSTFKNDGLFVCRFCGNSIAKCSELFAMSKHGVQTQYCNSAGYIHETNTVYQLLTDSVTFSGEPSREFSWFPGYAWHIIVCRMCTRHIGWKFRATEPNLTPVSFFGLSGGSVRISETSTVASNPRDELYRNILRMTASLRRNVH